MAISWLVIFPFSAGWRFRRPGRTLQQPFKSSVPRNRRQPASETILVCQTGLDLRGQRGTMLAVGWPVLRGVARQSRHPGPNVADVPPRGIAMTLKPIQGAPIDAPIPDFPTGEPGPLIMPTSRFARRAAEPLPVYLPPPAPSQSPTRRPGPIEIRGSSHTTLEFRCIPEIPAINRSSMNISITGEPTGDYSPQTMPHLDLTTDQAKVFLLALRDGDSPIVIADNRSGFQVEFVIAEDGPVFTVSKPYEERTARQFSAGWSYDVKTMAAHLLADLGP
jgi:hypothetical protein